MSTNRTLSNIRSRVQSFLEEMGVLRRTVALFAEIAPRATAVYLLIIALLAALPIAQAWLAREVINSVTIRNGSSTLALAVLYGLTLLLPAALSPAQQTLAMWLQDYTTAEVDRRLMLAGARMADLVRIERPAFQDEERALANVPFVLPRLFQSIQYGLGNGISLVGLLVLLGGLNPLLALALIAVTLPHLRIERKIAGLEYETMARNSRSAREMDYCAKITTEADAAKEVRVFGLGGFFLERFRDRFRIGFTEMRRVRLSHLRTFALFEGLHALTLAGGFWYVASEASAGQLTLGDLGLYVNALIQAEGMLAYIGAGFSGMFQVQPYARPFFRFLESARPSIALPRNGHGLAAPANLRSGIEMRRLSFEYPESDQPVLRDLDAMLAAGKVTALVGANGAGKSTLVKLLTRMYDPTAGDLLLDGVPVSDYDLGSLRSRIAVVYQDFARFALTLRDNITVGVAGTDKSCCDIRGSARLSGADEVAELLPNDYDTELTRRFEGGVDLSGGQWQKVALARGFVRDAAFVILDEPTSALDADAEYQLFERFKELITGRTALIISHRFSTVRMADHIIVLEHGRIVETGSHDKLVSLGGRYAELFDMQAGRYR